MFYMVNGTGYEFGSGVIPRWIDVCEIVEAPAGNPEKAVMLALGKRYEMTHSYGRDDDGDITCSWVIYDDEGDEVEGKLTLDARTYDQIATPLPADQVMRELGATPLL